MAVVIRRVLPGLDHPGGPTVPHTPTRQPAVALASVRVATVVDLVYGFNSASPRSEHVDELT